MSWHDNRCRYGILVYPIWWYKMPMALYSLLEQVDFSGKNIVPVVGHGGSRLGGTDKDIQ
ncbi:flavodoxin [Moraxella canis]|uniref:flavodoxin n=1 Tax=Moraxella canis TaxID=90239 RepID=UPI001966C352